MGSGITSLKNWLHGRKGKDMFCRKNQYLFKFNDVCKKERYATVKAKCEADAVWKFINNRDILRVNLDCKYELVGKIKAI